MPQQNGGVSSGRGLAQQRWVTIAWLAGGLAALPPALAQQPPSDADVRDSAQRAAQEAQRQQERERQLREQRERAPDVSLPRPQSAAEDDESRPDVPCFQIRRIALKGDDLPQFAFLGPVLAALQPGPEPVCLGARGINRLMQRLQNQVIEHGYVTTRVLAEPQDLKTGTLTLTVLAGRVRAIRRAGEGSERATLWNALPTGPGRILDLRDIEQGLENLKRVPSAEADIQIAPADLPGESDLQVRWHQDLPFRGSLSVDDSGSDATGKLQGNLTLSLDHWWTLNDLAYVSFNHDLSQPSYTGQGTRGRSAFYSVPWGYALLALSIGRSSYQQTVPSPDPAAPNLYSGTNHHGEAKLSWLVARDARHKTTVSLTSWARSSRNFINDTEVEVQRRRTGGWELGLEQRTHWGPAILDLDLAGRRGTGWRQSMPAPEELQGEGTSRMALATANAQLSVPFNVEQQSLRWSTSWRAQWNRSPLVAQDRFVIGSRYSVRGFTGDSNLAGEHGWLLRNDLAFALGDSNAELYFGGDWGHVGGPSVATQPGDRLAGAVIGVRGSFKRVSAELFTGIPVVMPTGFNTPSHASGFNLALTF
jgi:hemolysin activation/secretion protein